MILNRVINRKFSNFAFISPVPTIYKNIFSMYFGGILVVSPSSGQNPCKIDCQYKLLLH